MNTETSQVVITDIKMPFMSMVLFMVKAAIAAIPAFIIPGIMGMLVAAIFGGIFGGLGTTLALAHPDEPGCGPPCRRLLRYNASA